MSSEGLRGFRRTRAAAGLDPNGKELPTTQSSEQLVTIGVEDVLALMKRPDMPTEVREALRTWSNILMMERTPEDEEQVLNLEARFKPWLAQNGFKL